MDSRVLLFWTFNMVAPKKDGGLGKEMSVLEPLEHSVLGLPLEGGDVCGDEVVGLHR